KEHFVEGLDPEIDQALRPALKVYQDQGATIKDVSLPHSTYALAAYDLVAPAEPASNLARYDGMHYAYPAKNAPTLINTYEKTHDPLSMYLSDVYTISCNLAGITGVSVPCGFTKSGLPIGLQIQAAPFEEEKLLRVARMFERATDWHTRRPTV